MAWFCDRKNVEAWRILTPALQAADRRTEDLWPALRRAFVDILEKQSSDQCFDDLYRNAYEMVARKDGERLYQGLREAVFEHLSNKVRALVLAKADDDGFLQTLNRAWGDHQTSMKMIGSIVTYMDYVYVLENNVDSVHRVSVLLFRDEVARHADVRDRLREAMLGLVKAEREGKPVDRLLLKKACEMLTFLGLDSRTVYEEDFEKPFLEESAKFYALRGQHYIETKDAVEYAGLVEQHVYEELERAKQCMDKATLVPIKTVVTRELIEKHMKAIVEMEDSGVEHMLRNLMTDDLARLFRLLNCVQDGVKTLLDCVSKYLRNLGRSIVNDHGDSVRLIPKLMELRHQFAHVLRVCCGDDQVVQQTLATDFEYVVNLTRKSPQQLSAFVDVIMRREIRNMTKEDVGRLTEDVMVIFRPLQEKDLFERYYKQHLAKRLLLNEVASKEAEIAMVAKLRDENGCLDTSKMEAMFKDIHVSDNTTREFKTATHSCGMQLDGVDLNVRVLTTGFWPLAAATEQSNIPAAPWNAFQTFRRFYLAKHDGRRLTLQPHLGWADLSAVFYGPAKNGPSTSQAATTSSGELQSPRTYTIQVTTYQMCVLMLFNSRDQISYEIIASETNIPETSLVRALNSLCAARTSEPVLTKTPASNEIEKDHVFAVNDAFTSVLQKIKIDSTTSKKSAQNGNEPVINLDEDRRYELEAAIVRVMEARRTLSHNDLLVEVANLLRNRYTPSAAAFERRVNALVEREYLERATDDPEVYNYLP